MSRAAAWLWRLGEAAPSGHFTGAAPQGGCGPRWLQLPTALGPPGPSVALLQRLALAPPEGGFALWLSVGPVPEPAACRVEARALGLEGSNTLLWPMPTPEHLPGRLRAALALPHVATVVVDARDVEGSVHALLQRASMLRLIARAHVLATTVVILGSSGGPNCAQNAET